MAASSNGKMAVQPRPVVSGVSCVVAGERGECIVLTASLTHRMVMLLLWLMLGLGEQKRSWPLMHFNPDKTTTEEFILKKVDPFLDEKHHCKNKPDLYLIQSNCDKEICKDMFDSMYSEHLTMCAQVCGLEFRVGTGSTLPFRVHSRQTLGSAWAQSAASEIDVSKFCWLMFHSHDSFYRKLMGGDLQTVAQERILQDVGAIYRVGDNCNSKTCIQKLCTRLICAYRNDMLEKGLKTTARRLVRRTRSADVA